MPGLLSDVITTYLRETPGRIDRIIAAVGNGDAKIAERRAHGLKGSSSALGALKMAKLCEERSSGAARLETSKRARLWQRR